MESTTWSVAALLIGGSATFMVLGYWLGYANGREQGVAEGWKQSSRFRGASK